MSGRKKKYKMKKPLSPKEQERRRQLRAMREERKRLEKKKSRKKFWGYAGFFILIIGAFVGFVIFDVMHDTDIFMYYVAALLALGALLCDNGGIRSFIFCRFTDKFFFSDWIKRPNDGQCRTVEFCKTFSYYAVIVKLSLLIFKISAKKNSFIIAAVWLICVLVTVFYLIFDDDTPIRPGDSPKNGLSSAGTTVLLTSLGMLFFTSENFFVSRGLVIFTIVFTAAATVLFLAVSTTWHEHKDYIFLFALSVGIFAFSGFCVANEAFDFSEPREYTVMIVDMDYVSGRSSSYDLYVQDWHGGGEPVDIDVSSDTYRSLAVGDRIIVREYGGALGMEYFYYAGKANN